MTRLFQVDDHGTKLLVYRYRRTAPPDAHLRSGGPRAQLGPGTATVLSGPQFLGDGKGSLGAG
jgi:hypothetical protein